MAGSVRSPLGVWLGGAGAYGPRGVRSLLAFWMGGGNNPTTQAGLYWPLFFRVSGTGAAVVPWHLLKNDKLFTSRFRRREHRAGVV